MRKYFCDRCKDECNLETGSIFPLNKFINSKLFDEPEFNGYELCDSCKDQLVACANTFLSKFMNVGNKNENKTL